MIAVQAAVQAAAAAAPRIQPCCNAPGVSPRSAPNLFADWPQADIHVAGVPHYRGLCVSRAPGWQASPRCAGHYMSLSLPPLKPYVNAATDTLLPMLKHVTAHLALQVLAALQPLPSRPKPVRPAGGALRRHRRCQLLHHECARHHTLCGRSERRVCQ